MKKNLLVFDLDGTLIDSSGDIAHAANRTLESLGLAPMERAAIKDNIGWGVNMLLLKLVPGIEGMPLERARQSFLAFYGERLMEETRLYPGVMDTLSHFKRMGLKLAILTNKPEALSRRIIDELSLEAVFVNITGGDTFAEKKPDPAPLIRIMEETGAAPADTAIIGDSPIDCEAGVAAGVFTVGASYGFRPVEELKESGCDMIISEFSLLKEIFS